MYGLATTVEQINDYGHITGLDVVIDMIVDDGDATKARRNLLLAATNNYLGVFSGEHVSEGHAICVTLAETYVDNIDNTTVPIDAAGYTTIDTALFDQQNAAR